MFNTKQTFFFIFFYSIVFCQNSTKSLQDSITKYYSKDVVKAKFYCKKLEKNLSGSKNSTEKIINYCYMADLSDALSQKDSVLYYYDKAMDISIKSGEMQNELVVNINKANFFNSNFDFERALTIYDDCLKIAIKLNDSYAVPHIRMQKANILYDLERYDESIKNYKESLKNKKLPINDVLKNKLGLTKVYFKINRLDSVFFSINDNIKLSRSVNNKIFEVQFLKELSVYHRIRKEYNKSELVINSAIEIAKQIKNESIYPDLILAKAELLTVTNRSSESIGVLLELLSNSEKSLKIEKLGQMYYVLSENYKEINDFSNSNKYLNLYIDTSKKLGQKKIDAIDHLHKIDITELKSREENLVNQKIILYLIVFALFISVIGFYIIKRKSEKENQIKFEDLLLKINEYEENNKNRVASLGIEDEIKTPENVASYEDKFEEIEDEAEEFIDDIETGRHLIEDTSFTDFEIKNTSQNELVKTDENEITSFVIKDATVNEILDKLIKLEEKKYYLRQDFTLHNVAKRMKTNTAYLSKIINSELGKSFSTYANELRINYIILELKNNAKLRSYSINAIAEEIGYKSPESFTKYFKIATGISPSVYIKKINEMK